MDSTANQFSHGCAKMEIKQAHVISSSQGEKGGEWGRETRKASREEGDDGGCHGYVVRGWREVVIHSDLRGVWGWSDGAQCYSTEREQSLPAVDVGTVIMAWYVGTILTDKEYQSLLSRTLRLAALTFIPE